MANMLFTTRACVMCGHTTDMVIDTYDYVKWQGGMFVQDAFPYLTADERELLKTGTHPDCWGRMFDADIANEDG